MLSGRQVEAERQWLELLQHPELATANAEEGFAFLCELGRAADLPRSIDVYRRRSDARATLLLACEDRLEFARQLEAEWPRVTQILRAKNASFGHCHEYGPFSD